MTMTEPPTTQPPIATPATHWSGADADARWISVARTVATQLADHAERHDREGSFVQDGFDLLRSRDFMSLLVPSDLGGGGASHAEACAVVAELAHGCPSTSLAYSMHSHLVAAQVWRHHRDLPAPVLDRVAANQLVLISTGAADWIDSNGSATKVDGGFRVTARKLPSSGCPAGDVVVASVRWEDAPDGPQVIHCSIPFAADGVTIEETWDAMGMRGTGSHTIVLDEVFVPDEAVALIRPAGVWHPIWSVVVGAALPLIMSSYVGVAESAAGRAIEMASRKSDRPDVAPLVGRMLNRLTTARDTVRAMIEASDDLRFDNTLDSAAASLTRKSIAAEACIDTVRLALEIGGGAAFSRTEPIERMFRDVHGSLFHPLPTAQQERFTGRVALGLDPLG
ncbi:MAG: acyl-CoA dehydrogenase family protein [Acidimicrobiales bacterium]